MCYALRTMKRKRYEKKDFKWVNWGPVDFKRIAASVIKRKTERYAKIYAIPASQRTFENTVYALEASDDDLSDDLSRIGLLKEVSSNPKIRIAAAKTAEILHKKLVEIEYDPRMYAALK